MINLLLYFYDFQNLRQGVLEISLQGIKYYLAVAAISRFLETFLIQEIRAGTVLDWFIKSCILIKKPEDIFNKTLELTIWE